MDGFPRAVALGQITPSCSRTENPEDSVQDNLITTTGTAADSLELITEEVQDVQLGPRQEKTAKNLVHEIFEQSTIYGWEIDPSA